jgi:hypothetical protein
VFAIHALLVGNESTACIMMDAARQEYYNAERDYEDGKISKSTLEAIKAEYDARWSEYSQAQNARMEFEYKTWQ